MTDEKTLWERYKREGDLAARDALVLHYMKTVRYIAGRMAIHVPSHVELDDLIGWGTLGLLDAIEKYDPAQDTKFATYASLRIRGAILDEIRSLDWAPRSVRQMARRLAAARERLRQEQGKDPSTAELAEALGVGEDQVENLLSDLMGVQILSLDDFLPHEDQDERQRAGSVANPRAPDPATLAVEREKVERLAQAILKLPETMQKVLHLYYYEELTLKEIGQVLNVSESRVCQIHSAAMKSLRAVLREESHAPTHRP
jgi:RNA polymerase sigma factor for flagellar operon FliA